MRSLFLALLVACGGSAPAPSAPPEAPGREVGVLISGAGYSPDRVEASPGERITLVFERLDENNCGEEVVFPATQRTVVVPVGEKTPVTVTAPESGEIAFACGMAMYQGKLVVKES